MLTQLNNRYFGLRHGHSEANEAGIVVSNPEVGTSRYGLTDLGRDQVVASLRENRCLGSDTLIVCSDFKRAVETAEIAQTMLTASVPRTDARLRERYFGMWDMKSSSGYETVWDQDALDPTQTIGDVESPAGVSERVGALIASIEAEEAGRRVLLVSHGDTLHLAQALFEGRCPSQHRQIQHWETAELRELVSPSVRVLPVANANNLDDKS
jgi:glucosyl-3-phosphoglycerate phosphatase